MKNITLEILLQLMLSLPLSKKERDTVIQMVIERCIELYPAQVTHKITQSQREKRRKQGLNASPTLTMDTAFTVPFE